MYTPPELDPQKYWPQRDGRSAKHLVKCYDRNIKNTLMAPKPLFKKESLV
jgi:hypothetical protein